MNEDETLLPLYITPVMDEAGKNAVREFLLFGPEGYWRVAFLALYSIPKGYRVCEQL